MRRSTRPFKAGICTALAIALSLAALGGAPVSDAQEETRIYLPLGSRCGFNYPVLWGTVVRVIDGDTITMDVNGDGYEDFHVRYIGVDAPETNQCYGREATAFNRQLVEGQRVALEKDYTEGSYGRLLRYVYLSDCRWVNGVLVREGYAWVNIPPDSRDKRYEAQLRALQEQARWERRGGWAACGW